MLVETPAVDGTAELGTDLTPYAQPGGLVASGNATASAAPCQLPAGG
jgi:hypothetical protein